jgi:hypothetical protein
MADRQLKDSEKKYLDQKMEYYYNRISADIRATFTSAQENEIKTIIKQIIPVPAKKIMDVRFTFWFLKKMFAVIFIGVSKRKKERKSDISGLHKFFTLEFKLIFYIFEIAVGLFVLLGILFLLKVLFGINIIKIFY